LAGLGSAAAGIGDGAGRLLTGGGDLVNAIMINNTARSNSAPSIPRASIPRNLFGGGGGTTSAVALRAPGMAEKRDTDSVFTPPPADSKSEDKPALNPGKSSEFKPQSDKPLELEKTAPSTPQRRGAPSSTPRTPITPPPSEAKNTGDDSDIGDTKDDQPAREFKGDDRPGAGGGGVYPPPAARDLQADKDSFRPKLRTHVGMTMFDRLDSMEEDIGEQFEEHRGKRQLTRDMDEARAEAKQSRRKQQEATAKVGKMDTVPIPTKRATTPLEALHQKKSRDAGNLEELIAAEKQARAKKAKAAGKKRQEDTRAAAEPVNVDLSYMQLPRGLKRNEVFELAEEKEGGGAKKKRFYDLNATALYKFIVNEGL